MESSETSKSLLGGKEYSVDRMQEDSEKKSHTLVVV